MTDYERKRQMELKAFITRNFIKPADCRNFDQIRFYVNELSLKIAELEAGYNYAPPWSYDLLAEYITRENKVIVADCYC